MQVDNSEAGVSVVLVVYNELWEHHKNKSSSKPKLCR